MKIKTSELTGAALAWAVADCENIKMSQRIASLKVYGEVRLAHGGVYSPSTDWSQGGPIIDRERISHRVDTRGGRSVAFLDGGSVTGRMTGPTPLIAAMRCYVASKLGHEVEIPEELT